jgi:hypothetical protein
MPEELAVVQAARGDLSPSIGDMGRRSSPSAGTTAIQLACKGGSTMAIGSNSSEAIPAHSESYYEQLACEEEIYLEETEEELRARLVSDEIALL